MQAKVVADGQPSLPSAAVVFKVLLQNSTNITFFKNAAITTPSLKFSSAGEEMLHRELDSEQQGSAVLFSMNNWKN